MKKMNFIKIGQKTFLALFLSSGLLISATSNAASLWFNVAFCSAGSQSIDGKATVQITTYYGGVAQTKSTTFSVKGCGTQLKSIGGFNLPNPASLVPSLPTQVVVTLPSMRFVNPANYKCQAVSPNFSPSWRANSPDYQLNNLLNVRIITAGNTITGCQISY